MCHVCHYENKASVASCEICSTEKPTSTRVVPVRVSVSAASSSSGSGGGKQDVNVVQTENVVVPKTNLSQKVGACCMLVKKVVLMLFCEPVLSQDSPPGGSRCSTCTYCTHECKRRCCVVVSGL